MIDLLISLIITTCTNDTNLNMCQEYFINCAVLNDGSVSKKSIKECDMRRENVIK